jgi:hypothetical protein
MSVFPGNFKLNGEARGHWLRALSMLYIVGFWHLFNYTSEFREYDNEFTAHFTNIVLALFIFLSGFYLTPIGGQGASGYIELLRRRLLKLYPLYASATATYFIASWITPWSLFTSLILLGGFLAPRVPTLWFILVIFIFYLVYPFVSKGSNQKKMLRQLAVFIAFWIIATYGQGDMRLVFYWPAFCMGYWLRLFPARYGIRTLLICSMLLFVGGIISIFATHLQSIYNIPLVLGGVATIWAAATISLKTTPRVLILLSYSSFSMY